MSTGTQVRRCRPDEVTRETLCKHPPILLRLSSHTAKPLETLTPENPLDSLDVWHTQPRHTAGSGLAPDDPADFQTTHSSSVQSLWGKARGTQAIL